MKKFLLSIFLVAMCGSIAFAAGQEEAAGTGMDKITYSCYFYYQMPDSEKALEDYFLESTGVELDVVNIAKDSWEDKIRAMMVSGDAGDVTQLPSNMVSLVKQGYIKPIDDYIDTDPGFSQLKAEYPQVFRLTTYEDKIYGVAAGSGSYMNLWIRDDWLDELGLDMPETMDEVVAALAAFKGTQFDIGKGDIPLVMTNSIWNHDVFANYWGVFNEVVLHDGKYTDFQLTTEFKEYLDFMRDLYERGILDREMPTTGYGDARNKGGLGNAGSVVMWDDTYDSFAKNFINNGIEGAMMAPVPPFAGDKGVFGLSYSPEGTHYGISSTAEDPEFVFNTFFNWFFFQKEGIIASSRGVPGFDFTVEDGVLVPTGTPGSGVGYKGQKFPPVLLDFEYPFKLDPISQGEYDNILQVRQWAQPFFDETEKIYPPKDAERYWNIEGDLYDTKRALNSRYIFGEINYDEFVSEYRSYINEIQLEDMLNEMNSNM